MKYINKYLFHRFPHPAYPTVLFLILGFLLSGWALHRDPIKPGLVAALLLAGFLSWTLVEYLLHRFVFHWTEVSEPWRSLASGLHMAHHGTPDAKDLIVAPPFVSLSFAGIIFGIFWAFSQNAAAAALMICGLFAGYCFYEWVHYAAHHYPLHSPLGRFWKKYHMQHHHKHPNLGFGVTTSFWDHLFGTFPPKT